MLPAIFKRENLDLLHLPYFSFPIFYPGKFVVTIHDLIFDHYKTGMTSTLPPLIYQLKKIGYHLVLSMAINRAQKIITLSHNSKKEIIEHYKADPAKIIITYESGSLEGKLSDFNSSKFQKIKDLQPYLLYVGNAHPHKNIESLIIAMEYIDKVEKDWKLVLIGSDTFFYPRLKEFIKNARLEDKVILIGEVANSELSAWYHFALALITASNMEGFGIPPLEAMTLGCPAIVSDISVFHEIYGDAAAYFNQNDPQDITRVILETLNNKKNIKEIILKGYLRSKMYSWEKMARETLAIYNQILR